MGAEWRNPKQSLLLLGVDDTCTSSVSKKYLDIDKVKWGKEKEDSRPQNPENRMMMVVRMVVVIVAVVACVFLCSGAHTQQENKKHLSS